MTFSGFVVNGVFTGYGGKKVLGYNVIARKRNPEKISAPGKSTLLYPPYFYRTPFYAQTTRKCSLLNVINYHLFQFSS